MAPDAASITFVGFDTDGNDTIALAAIDIIAIDAVAVASSRVA